MHVLSVGGVLTVNRHGVDPEVERLPLHVQFSEWTHITSYLYLPSEFRVAYTANISEHLPDHNTLNYIPCSLRQ